MSRFGTLLRKFRERAGYSQRKLAKEAQIDTSYISRLESGEREVASRLLAIRIADFLKLSAEETDLWFISAGYVSPRIQELTNLGVSRLYEEMEQLKHYSAEKIQKNP